MHISRISELEVELARRDAAADEEASAAGGSEVSPVDMTSPPVRMHAFKKRLQFLSPEPPTGSRVNRKTGISGKVADSSGTSVADV